MERTIFFTGESRSYLGQGGGLYKQRKSFLDHLLNIQKDSPDLLSDNDIRDEVNTFMFEVRAGSFVC